MTDIPKKITYSYSSISKFETCPYQWYCQYILKNIEFIPNDAVVWGQQTHDEMDKRLKTGNPLPDRFKGYEKYARVIENYVEKVDGHLETEYEMAIDENDNRVGWWDKTATQRGKTDVSVFHGNRCGITDWKGLPLDTEIPSINKFITMGDLEEGDIVFGGDGKPCVVVDKSQIHNRKCYQVNFDDKTSVVCDEFHLWKLHDGSVVSVTELNNKNMILLTGEVKYPEADLPIDPYVLGIWLADGKHTSGELCKPDKFIWDEIKRRGYEYSTYIQKDRCRTGNIFGIRKMLNYLNLLRNKHIPDMYLYASIDQRKDLVRGLMDGDGNANTVRGQAVFTNTNELLSRQLKQVLASLSQRVNKGEVLAKGFGVETWNYPLAFKPQKGFNPFLLPRKAERVENLGEGNSWRRRVVSVEEVESVPTQCISVNSKDNTYLCTRDYIPTHNTGKYRPQTQELEYFSLLTYKIHPEVEDIRTVYTWFKGDGPPTIDQFNRTKDFDKLENEFNDKIYSIEQAMIHDMFPKKKSGLCRNYCGSPTCKNSGNYQGEE